MKSVGVRQTAATAKKLIVRFSRAIFKEKGDVSLLVSSTFRCFHSEIFASDIFRRMLSVLALPSLLSIWS